LKGPELKFCISEQIYESWDFTKPVTALNSLVNIISLEEICTMLNELRRGS